MGEMSFELPIKMPSLNEYIDECRRNRYAGAKTKKRLEAEIALYLPRETITEPVYIEFEWHEATRRRDKDNVAFGKKFILDAMQKSGLIKNDSNRFIKGFTDRFVYDGTNRVVVRVMRMEETS